MPRTKADSAKKVGGKAPRKGPALRNDPYQRPLNGSKASKSNGNAYCARPTPDWQKPISNFFPKEESNPQVARSEELQCVINMNQTPKAPAVAPSASLGADPLVGPSISALHVTELYSEENIEIIEVNEDSSVEILEDTEEIATGDQDECTVIFEAATEEEEDDKEESNVKQIKAKEDLAEAKDESSVISDEVTSEDESDDKEKSNVESGASANEATEQDGM